MNRQSGTDFRKKFAGNTTLYSDSKIYRSPVFLQRSINSVLTYHKQKLLKGLGNSCSKKAMSTCDSIPEESSSNQPRSGFWSLKELEASIDESRLDLGQPVLRIELKGIKDKRERFQFSHGEPASKRLKASRIRAQCALTIWDAKSSKQEYVVTQTKPCIIITASSSASGSLATIEMDEAFSVRASELFSSRNAKSLPDRAEGTAYMMQITLLSTTSDDQWPPVPIKLPTPRDAQVYDQGETVRAPMLLAKWLRLPECPQAGSFLTVSAYQDAKEYKTKLALEIEAAWNIAASPLVVHNQQRKQASSPKLQLPSPTSDICIPKSIVTVNWSFVGQSQEDDILTYDGYLCPLCNKLDLKNLDSLHFHLINSHDLFKFRLKSDATATLARLPKVAVDVSVDVADDYRERAANHVPDDREMAWKKPQRLFDLEAFLKGDASWLGKPSRKPRLQITSRLQASSSSESRDWSKAETPIIKSRQPDAVPDLAAPNRRKHRVPAAPRMVQYFRSTPKRPLEEGEWLSESDDDIHEGWLLQRHEETIQSFTDMSLSEKEFILRFDKHVLKEDLSSYLHLGEALVRFCRLNRKWLRRKDMGIEFHKHAAKLMLHGIVDHLLVQACVRIIQDRNRDDSENEARDLDEHRKAASRKVRNVKQECLSNKKVSPRRRWSPKTMNRSPKQAVHELETCSCQKSIYDMRTCIRCSNVDCDTPYYHFRCAGIIGRVPDWLCASCRPRTGDEGLPSQLEETQSSGIGRTQKAEEPIVRSSESHICENDKNGIDSSVMNGGPPEADVESTLFDIDPDSDLVFREGNYRIPLKNDFRTKALQNEVTSPTKEIVFRPPGSRRWGADNRCPACFGAIFANEDAFHCISGFYCNWLPWHKACVGPRESTKSLCPHCEKGEARQSSR